MMAYERVIIVFGKGDIGMEVEIRESEGGWGGRLNCVYGQQDFQQVHWLVSLEIKYKFLNNPAEEKKRIYQSTYQQNKFMMQLYECKRNSIGVQLGSIIFQVNNRLKKYYLNYICQQHLFIILNTIYNQMSSIISKTIPLNCPPSFFDNLRTMQLLPHHLTIIHSNCISFKTAKKNNNNYLPKEYNNIASSHIYILNPSVSMQSQPQNPGDVRALVLLQIELVFMHRLLKNQKTLFTSGTLRIAKLQNSKAQPVYFININSFYYGIQRDTYFIKVPYQDTIAYVFPHFDNGLSAISVLAHCPEVQQLDHLLGQAAKLITIKEAFEIGHLSFLIHENYPILQKEQIHYPDSIKKVISTAGNFIGKAFTKVGEFVKGGVEKAGNYLNDKISEGEPRHVEEATKEKWQKFKEGTNNFMHVSADFACNLINPVVNKAKQYSNNIGDKIDKSESGTVKYAKELVQVSGRAIGEAFEGLVKGSTEIVSQIGSQGKKIMTKKYGEEVVHVIAGDEKESKEKHESGDKIELKKTEEPRVKEGQNKGGIEDELSNVRLNDHSEQKIQYPSLEK